MGARSDSHLGSRGENTDTTTALKTELLNLLRRSQERIQHCVSQLSAEQIWWRPESGDGTQLNSVGNLVLHICGNLRQWCLSGLAGNPDERDRDAEFSAETRRTADELLSGLDALVADVSDVISGLPDADLLDVRTVQGFQVSGTGILLHTVPHCVGHTHQIALLTRMQLGDDYQFHWDSRQQGGPVPL